MTPPPTLARVTSIDQKSQTPKSPASDVETPRSDAIIDIGDVSQSTKQSCSGSRSSVSDADKEKYPAFLRRIVGSLKPKPEPESVLETKIRILDDTPNGFPRLAAFQSSEANFSIYRSFSYLHSRVLLDLQDEITCLEKELDDFDLDDEIGDPDRLRSREVDIEKARDEGDSRNRRVILREIRQKLMEYDEVLIKAQTLESFQKPSDRNYRSVRRYHYNTKPLMDAEMDSIRSKEDTVSLHNGREWATFDSGVETLVGQADRLLQKAFRAANPPLQRLFRTPELEEKSRNKYIFFYSSSRIDKLVNVLIAFVIFILLVVPVVTIYHLTSTTANVDMPDVASNGTVVTANTDVNTRGTLNAVGVLLVFTLLFSAAMGLVTNAARYELFAVSAAYCAILVGFIGSFTASNN